MEIYTVMACVLDDEHVSTLGNFSNLISKIKLGLISDSSSYCLLNYPEADDFLAIMHEFYQENRKSPQMSLDLSEF